MKEMVDPLFEGIEQHARHEKAEHQRELKKLKRRHIGLEKKLIFCASRIDALEALINQADAFLEKINKEQLRGNS